MRGEEMTPEHFRYFSLFPKGLPRKSFPVRLSREVDGNLESPIRLIHAHQTDQSLYSTAWVSSNAVIVTAAGLHRRRHIRSVFHPRTPDQRYWYLWELRLRPSSRGRAGHFRCPRSSLRGAHHGWLGYNRRPSGTTPRPVDNTRPSSGCFTCGSRGSAEYIATTLRHASRA